MTFRLPSSGRTRPWQLRQGRRDLELYPPQRVQVSDTEVLGTAARLGRGVAQLPDYIVRDEIARGELVALLPQLQPAPMPISAVVPSGRLVPPRVRVLLEALASLREHHGRAVGSRLDDCRPAGQVYPQSAGGREASRADAGPASRRDCVERLNEASFDAGRTAMPGRHRSRVETSVNAHSMPSLCPSCPTPRTASRAGARPGDRAPAPPALRRDAHRCGASGASPAPEALAVKVRTKIRLLPSIAATPDPIRLAATVVLGTPKSVLLDSPSHPRKTALLALESD